VSKRARIILGVLIGAIAVAIVATVISFRALEPRMHDWVSDNLSNALDSKIELGEVIISMPRLIAFAVSIAITLALYWQLRFTELGRRIRAAASDRETAALMGINVNRVNLIAFGIGVGCLGIAGPIMMPVYYIVPNIGTFFILIAFVVVVLGGIGNFMGALLASFIVAIAESLGALFMPGSTAPVLPFLLFVLVLLLKPEGLFAGRPQ